MNVVQIGPMPPPHGGVSSNMMAIHSALIRSGCESRIIDVTNRAEVRTEPFVIKPKTATGLITTLLRLQCDILHFHIGGKFNPKLALLTWFCGLLPGTRSVVTFHSGGFAREALNFAKKRSLRGLAFRSIDRLIGVNDEMLTMFRLYGMPDSQIIKILPYELAPPDPSIEIPTHLERFMGKQQPLLLSVGALEPEYNNDQLIGAMTTILGQFPQAVLLIVGSGSEDKRLRDQIEAARLSHRVHLTGNLDHGLVLRLIGRANILFRLTEYDGDAISVREAHYLGTPVIASDNANRPPGTFLVETPVDPQDLVCTIIEARRAQFLGHTNQVPEPSNADKVLEVYRELIEK